MATSRHDGAVRTIRRAALRTHGGDGPLLDAFVTRRDEAAFEALVRRHGPMVWAVCRRLLTHHDAEDAFQATFLVLARKAAAVRPRELLPNWLYGVAYHSAQKARALAVRRSARERQVTAMPDPPATEPADTWAALQPVLDRELHALPDRYRAPIVLCDLEGLTRRAAAVRLGLPEGTVSSRLSRARAMLAHRLARHGLTVSAGLLAEVLSQTAATARVPYPLVSSTVRAVALLTAGPTAVGGAISAQATALTEGVLQAMLLTKLKNALATAAVVVFAATILGLVRRHPHPPHRGRRPTAAPAGRSAPAPARTPRPGEVGVQGHDPSGRRIPGAKRGEGPPRRRPDHPRQRRLGTRGGRFERLGGPAGRDRGHRGWRNRRDRRWHWRNQRSCRDRRIQRDRRHRRGRDWRRRPGRVRDHQSEHVPVQAAAVSCEPDA